jgi:metal transporter CNNM
VYDKNPKKPKDVTAIRGVLMTKQLIVIDSTDQRPISTLPLFTPACVSPKKNLVDLINMFQAGKHMALVCARPGVGNAALEIGEALPPSAGLMGVITLEDVLEQLLQEQILDETDKLERNEQRLAKWVSSRWHLFVNTQKVEREEALFRQSQDPKMLDIVKRAMAELNATDTPRPTDTRPLLGVPDGNEDKGSERRSGFLGLFR